MDVTASLDARAPCEAMYAVVRDLATYPKWLDIVHSVQLDQTQPGEDCAWVVELRGKVGPFARSKRLRMVRASDQNPGGQSPGDQSLSSQNPARVVFERRELASRRHSPWVLTATVAGTVSGSTLSVHLHYGGTLFSGGILERLLAEQISRGRERLLQLLTDN